MTNIILHDEYINFKMKIISPEALIVLRNKLMNTMEYINFEAERIIIITVQKKDKIDTMRIISYKDEGRRMFRLSQEWMVKV